MLAASGPYVLVVSLGNRIRAVRFLHPDLRRQLDGAEAEDTVLYNELRAQVFNDLQPNDTLIFNFGLVERFPTAFLQVMMKVRETAKSRNIQLLLCGFMPEILDGLNVMQADRLFEITHTEEQAWYKAQAT